MNEMDDALACIECGQPVPGGARWTCSERCHAVMNLVQYGRMERGGGYDWPDADQLVRLNRLRRQAGVLGHFPNLRLRNEVRGRDRGRCQHPGCEAQSAELIDWAKRDPAVARRRLVRDTDLVTVCAEHQRLRAQGYVRGQAAHTAPAVWARIEAVGPLLPRDDPTRWARTDNWSLLRHWPLASQQTRRDLWLWVAAMAGEPPGADVVEGYDTVLDRMELPLRRGEHLVRAIHAIAQAENDEVVREAVRQTLAADIAQASPMDDPRSEDAP